MAGIPRNAVSGRPYSGINVWLLGGPYPDPFWLTFAQAKKAGGTVRKGEKGSFVVFYKSYKKEASDGKEESRFVLRYYNVFNASQCDGVESLIENRQAEIGDDKPSIDADPIESAETILNGYIGGEYGPGFLACDQNSAYYAPTLDHIRMPKLESFETPEAYYDVAFHEIAHSTGHRNRLQRDSIVNHASFRSHAYSREELVAEFGASYLCALAGIDRESLTDNSAAYIRSWLKFLKSDPKAIVQAASKGEKAARWIMGERGSVAADLESIAA